MEDRVSCFVDRLLWTSARQRIVNRMILRTDSLGYMINC